jgi:predicted DNA-binding transcriptional regulator YafY
MSDTAAAQLRRVLHLIPRLADGEEHALSDVAKEAGTNAEQVLRDIASISERFDTPGGFVEGVSIWVEQDTVCVTAREFHRPMRLTMPELCALELGLAMLRRERTPAEQGPVDGALARLRHAISQVPSNERHEGARWAELGVAGAPEHLATIRAAIAARLMLELCYRAGAATESRVRTVAPHSLVFAEQMWYLVATADGGALRFFRVDRVEAVRVLDATFERDEGVGSRIQEAGRAFASDTTRRMTVRYSPRIARWVADREGVTLAADGSLTLEHPVADDSWAVRHVLQYGPDAELLAPVDLREVVRERLAEMSSRSMPG